MQQESEPVSFLRAEFIKRRAKNSAYSLRSFARHLGISPARLSEVLNRKRAITSNQIEKIAATLALDPKTIETFILSCQSGLKKGQPKKWPPVKKAYAELKLDFFRLVADWHHSAILCLVETAKANAEMSSSWIAKRLGISTVEAAQATERLIKIGLLRQKGKRLELTKKDLTTPTDVPSAALRQFHQQMLDKAKAALETESIDERDMTSITMAIDKAKLAEAKALIREFRRNLCSFLEEGAQTEVYALNIQLFQLSK